MRAFIVRPFGTKEGIDFEAVERELIDPALSRLGVSGRTTGEIAEQGNIRTDMFQRLATADLVIADISIHNANVFYELGLRHALRDRMTFLLRSRGVADVPFDLKTDRYLAYDAKDPAATLEALVRGLCATIDSGQADSPVFQLLPALAAQDPEALLVVPRDFREAMTVAAAKRRRSDLELLVKKATDGGFEWERAGLRLVGRAQFELEDWNAARRTWTGVLTLAPQDPEASLRMGTILQRSGDLDGSDVAVRRVLETDSHDRAHRAEAAALLGRNAKTRWLAGWRGLSEDDRRRAALLDPWLRTAIERYAEAFAIDLSHYYSGINALGMVSVLLDLAHLLPAEWAASFPGEPEAERELAEPEAERRRLDGALSLVLRAVVPKPDDVVWHALTRAEHALLTCQPAQAGWVANLYRNALTSAKDFHGSSAGDQLRIYGDLGLRFECVAAALECIEAEARKRGVAVAGGAGENRMPTTETASRRTEEPVRVLLFTGHRIDAPDREAPRFPPESEERGREMIRGAVEAELARARGEEGRAAGALLRGISGAASGGDILFLEVCRELEIPCEIYLAKPRDAYVKASVADAGPGWVDRFDRLLAALPNRVLSEDEELPRWLRGASRSDYSVWQRNNLWMLANALESAPDAAHLTLIALWDGEEGDGPGGTAHMIELACERGARTVMLDAKDLVEES